MQNLKRGETDEILFGRRVTRLEQKYPSCLSSTKTRICNNYNGGRICDTRCKRYLWSQVEAQSVRPGCNIECCFRFRLIDSLGNTWSSLYTCAIELKRARARTSMHARLCGSTRQIHIYMYIHVIRLVLLLCVLLEVAYVSLEFTFA